MTVGEIALDDLERIDLPDGRVLDFRFGERTIAFASTGPEVMTKSFVTGAKLYRIEPDGSVTFTPIVGPTIYEFAESAFLSFVEADGTNYVIGPCARPNLMAATPNDDACLHQFSDDGFADLYARIEDPPTAIDQLEPFSEPHDGIISSRDMHLDELEPGRWYRFYWPGGSFCNINSDLGRLRFFEDGRSVDNFHSANIRPGFSDRYDKGARSPPLAARYNGEDLIEISDVDGNAGFYFQSSAELTSCEEPDPSTSPHSTSRNRPQSDRACRTHRHTITTPAQRSPLDFFPCVAPTLRQPRGCPSSLGAHVSCHLQPRQTRALITSRVPRTSLCPTQIRRAGFSKAQALTAQP